MEKNHSAEIKSSTYNFLLSLHIFSNHRSIYVQEIIFEFMNNPKNAMLLFLNNGATFIPHLNKFPAEGVGKGPFAYFMRKHDNNETDLTPENMSEVGEGKIVNGFFLILVRFLAVDFWENVEPTD